MQSTISLLTLLLFSYFTYGSPRILPSVPSVQERTNDKLLNGRIVNGTKAALGQFPYQVSLQRSYSGEHFCGGSIISKTLVLTAGHCVFNTNTGKGTIQPDSILVAGGFVILNFVTQTTQLQDVNEIKLHPEFNWVTLQNDVAVLKLKQSFEFNKILHSLPLPGNNFTAGVTCQVAGWGYPDEGIRVVSDHLMFVDLPVLSVETCNKIYENRTVLLPGMYCAGYADGGRDSCQGDSGGGMICDNILTGIVSGGYGCAHPQTPGLYSDIFYFKDWITDGEYIEIKEKCKTNSSASITPTITVMTLCSLFLGLISIISRT